MSAAILHFAPREKTMSDARCRAIGARLDELLAIEQAVDRAIAAGQLAGAIGGLRDMILVFRGTRRDAYLATIVRDALEGVADKVSAAITARACASMDATAPAADS